MSALTASRRGLFAAARLSPASGLSAAAGAPALLLQARSLAVSAAAVKELAADQKALSAAVDALGANASLDAVQKMIEADPSLKATVEKVKASDLSWTWSMLASKPEKPPVTVAVAGAGSEAGAATLFRIAAGEMLGLDQPVNLQVAGAEGKVTAELEACGFPLLKGVKAVSNAAAAVGGAQYAIVLEGDAKAVGGAAAPGALVAIAGVTNAHIASKAAPKASVTAITAPAAAAAAYALSVEAGVPMAKVENVIAWGSGVADVSHALVGGKWALKASSGGALPKPADAPAGITADAVVAHMKAWACGSDSGWVMMGVPAVGDYGMGSGFFYSVPVTCTPGEYKRVGGITLAPDVASTMEAERTALIAEAKAAGL